MKKRLALLMALVMVFSLCCFGAPAAFADGKTVINVMSFTDEVPNMINRFVETHPDFADKYEINTTIIATTDGLYQPLWTRLWPPAAPMPPICTAPKPRSS